MLIVALCVLVAPGVASATTSYLQLDFANCGPTQTAQLWSNYPGTYIGNVYTGVYNLHINTAAGSYAGAEATAIVGEVDASHNVAAFCMDVNQSAPQGVGFQTYQVQPLEAAPVGGVNTPMTTAQANDLRRLYGSYYSTSLTGPQAAAFEASVWEIVFEQSGTYNVYGGNLRINETSGGSWGSIANGWLGNLGNVMNNNVMALVNQTYQDYAIVVPPSTGQEPPVPEPVTMASLLLAVGALGGYARRRLSTR